MLSSDKNQSEKYKNDVSDNTEYDRIYFLDFLKEWVETLYENLTNKMNSLKQIKIFNKPEITNYLSKLVMDLEQYFNSEINSVLEGNTQFDNFSRITDNFDLINILLNNTFKIQRDNSLYSNLKLLEQKLNIMMNKTKVNSKANYNKIKENIDGNLISYDDSKKFPSTKIYELINQNYEKYLELKDYEILKKIYEDIKIKSLEIVDQNVTKMKIVYKIFNYLAPLNN